MWVLVLIVIQSASVVAEAVVRVGAADVERSAAAGRQSRHCAAVHDVPDCSLD